MTTPENRLRVGIPRSEPGFRAALASRDFTLLFLGQLGAGIGNGLMQIALPFLVLRLTGSALQLGLAYFFQFLPVLLFGVLGGVLVDRWDRRRTIVLIETLRAAAFLSIGIIYYLGALRVEHVYTVIFIEATLANFFNPARAALMPNLVPPENLRPANSLMEVSRTAGLLVAPSFGGFLSAYLGPAAVMLINGVTLQSAQMMLSQTAVGLGTIWRSRLLQVAVGMGFSLNLIIAPIQLLLPLFVTEVKNTDERYFGLLVVGMALGVIAGSLLAPVIARRLGLGRMTIAAVLLLGALVSVAAWPPTLWPPLAAICLAGAAIGALNVAQTTMLQSATTDDERGRVSATYFTATLGVRPFGMLAMGAMAEAVDDIRFLFVGLGVATILLGAVLSRLPEVRQQH
jgi:MFS family permease